MLRYALILSALALVAPMRLLAESASPSPPGASAPATKLAYVMVFVSDMNRSIAFYRDQVGLKPRFVSPTWSEFETGETILALHPAGPDNRAGTSEIGVTVADLNAFYAMRRAAGVSFAAPPTQQHYGSPLAEMRGPDGESISVGGR